MSNWDKDLFIEHLREHCNREIAKVGVSIIEFTEKHVMIYLGVVVQIMEP